RSLRHPCRSHGGFGDLLPDLRPVGALRAGGARARRSRPGGAGGLSVMPTYRLTIEYDGTRYHGWQEQANARSVTGEIRRAIEDTGERLVELGGSGRTDAGVHALAQVAHMRLAEEVLPEPYRLALNDRLPPDVHLLELRAAPERFHARHDATARS